jgi:hypothetical protein
MNRKHMPLLVGGAVVLVLACALFYLLYSTHVRYADGAAQLSTAQSSLQRLSSRPIFPSDANVQTMGKQLEIYQDYLDGLYDSMREGQRPAKPVDRDGFRKMLEEGLGNLMREAQSKSVAIAPDFAFGVQRYIAGTPPAEEDLPRLVDQFSSIGELCRILFEAGIGELVSVDRAVFEKDAQVAPAEEEYGRRSSRNRPETETAAPSAELFKDPDGLFTKEHYVLTYRAQDAANWKVLDRLSHAAPFVVVTRMEIANPARPTVVPPKSEEKTAAAAPTPVSTAGWKSAGTETAVEPGAKEEPEILPRELRIVAGQELPNVRLELDLYRFAEAVAVADKGEENP